VPAIRARFSLAGLLPASTALLDTGAALQLPMTIYALPQLHEAPAMHLPALSPRRFTLHATMGHLKHAIRTQAQDLYALALRLPARGGLASGALGIGLQDLQAQRIVSGAGVAVA